MQPRARVSTVDIHQHAVKKKAAFEAEPSQSLKKGRAVAASASTREPDVLSKSVPEPVLMLSIPRMLPEVPFIKDGVAGEDGVVAIPSAARTAEVRTIAEVMTELE